MQIDGRSWAYEIDLATGTATLDTGGQPRTVQPLTWREKVTLARYSRAGTDLIDAALVDHRLGALTRVAASEQAAGSFSSSPADRALVALARWLNGFGPQGDAAPLDSSILTSIGALAARSSGLRPVELDALPAAEVELLAAVAQEAPSTAASAARGAMAGDGTDSRDDGLTRIVIVPDPVARPAGPATSSGSPSASPSAPATSSSARHPQFAAPADAGSADQTHRPGAGIGLLRAGGTSARDLPFLGDADARTASGSPARPVPARRAVPEAIRKAPSARASNRPFSRPARTDQVAVRVTAPGPEAPLMAGHPPADVPTWPTGLSEPTEHIASPDSSRVTGGATWPADAPARTVGAAAAPAVATIDVDDVLAELARRLEQAVDDLGLDLES